MGTVAAQRSGLRGRSSLSSTPGGLHGNLPRGASCGGCLRRCLPHRSGPVCRRSQHTLCRLLQSVGQHEYAHAVRCAMCGSSAASDRVHNGDGNGCACGYWCTCVVRVDPNPICTVNEVEGAQGLAECMTVTGGRGQTWPCRAQLRSRPCPAFTRLFTHQRLAAWHAFRDLRVQSPKRTDPNSTL